MQDKWITLPRFQRVFAVYQILPGPEAAELCMFFGCLSAGRVGGIIAGLAFMLPGFVLMLLASYLYSLAGFENKYFNASFRALQPIVAAMVMSISISTAQNPFLPPPFFPPPPPPAAKSLLTHQGSDLQGSAQDSRPFRPEARYKENRSFPHPCSPSARLSILLSA